VGGVGVGRVVVGNLLGEPRMAEDGRRSNLLTWTGRGPAAATGDSHGERGEHQGAVRPWASAGAAPRWPRAFVLVLVSGARRRRPRLPRFASARRLPTSAPELRAHAGGAYGARPSGGPRLVGSLISLGKMIEGAQSERNMNFEPHHEETRSFCKLPATSRSGKRTQGRGDRQGLPLARRRSSGQMAGRASWGWRSPTEYGAPGSTK